MKSLLALLACCVATAAVAQAPKVDMTGVWRRADYKPAVVVDGGGQPRMTAEGARLYSAHRAAAARGDRSYDTSTICLPEGIPRLMLKAEPFEILQRPTLVAFNYQINRLPRVVYLDAKPPIENGGYYLGESTGKWEGDTLVIDTRGFNTETLVDDSGLPHSEDMTVTERLTLSADGKKLTKPRPHDRRGRLRRAHRQQQAAAQAQVAASGPAQAPTCRCCGASPAACSAIIA